jgi:hypothetical protein
MNARIAGVIAALLVLAACGSGSGQPTTTPPTTKLSPTTTHTRNEEIQNMMDLPHLQPVKPGTYFMDPDLDPATPLRVVYELPVDGWSHWLGAVKFGDDGHVALTITTVNNLVKHGCDDHAHAEPPIGPSVDDLATALGGLAPFQVTSPAEDVIVYGYSGRHLEWIVPELPVDGSGDQLTFTGCTGGQLMSWVAPWDTTSGDAFYGYTGPGYTEEFWILDVEGTRVMIAAERSADSPQQDLEELTTILDSIQIEP